MAEIPAAFQDLLSNPRAFAHLATVNADGAPQVTPVWFDVRDGKVRVNSARGRVKSRNMHEGARVALSIPDPDNAYRYMQIRGKVVRASEQGGDAHIDALAKKYLDRDSYPFRREGEVRVIFEIEPTSVNVMG
ncbi:MAG: PPOX class F420-dependent oxidoreductase [Acetobacteraceae bacterium]|nr:PPOX class F420-dependent oxidoreductase [Acetobacteraceae bacterium]